MPLIDRLPAALENGDALLKRRAKAAEIKEQWRGTYTDCYRFAMPQRETFNWTTPGQRKEAVLYDSTLQDCTYQAANTMTALLFPVWARWAELAAGGAMPKGNLPPEIVKGLQDATEVFFDFLNHSNFSTVIGETALDLLAGTGAMDFDEGDDANPFRFTAIPLSSLEIEEGPDGTIETTYMPRKPVLRNLVRMYDGMEEFDLPQSLHSKLLATPDETVEIIQCKVYDPGTKHYYGIVVDQSTKSIIWRFDYGTSNPTIVARAFKKSGETYGRGRIMLALADARTLDKMQEFILRAAALQVAPPMTAVSDGVLNPHTAVLAPNLIVPVMTNDRSNPSIQMIEIGGNLAISDAIMDGLRERIRRTMLGPEPSEGPVKSATEIGISDRNRLWAMGGEFGRIQAELQARIMTRGVHILQKKGIIPKFKVDGREVTVKFTSPFAKSQSAEDLLALERTISVLGGMGEPGMGSMQMGLKMGDLPDWIARKTGLDMSIVNTKEERDLLQQQAAEAAQAAMADNPETMGGAA